MFYRNALFIALSASLYGCGGGGGNGNVIVDTPPANPPVDVIPDDSEDDTVPTPVGNPAFPMGASNNYDLIKASVFRDMGFDGTGVRVAVLDSGLSDPSSVDFDVTMLENQDYTETGTEFIKSTETYTSDSGNSHGKSMSEIIGSQSVGIAPGVEIIHGVISFSDGYTDMFNQQFGAQWASMNGADIINISYSQGELLYPDRTGYSAKYDQLHGALKTLDDNGSVIVHSAGNNAVEFNAPYADGNFSDIVLLQPDNVLYVGAVDNYGVLATYSNTPGGSVDYQLRYILAPSASDVVSSVSYGTSGAAANVTGALALMSQRWSTTPVTELAQLVLDTANKDIPNYDPAKHGQGVLDMYRATQPYGATVVSTASNAKLPDYAMSVSLPAGFKSAAYEQTFFDSIGRDFQANLVAPASSYQSRFASEFNHFGVEPASVTTKVSDTLSIGFTQMNNRYQSEDKIERNLIQMNSVSAQMFKEPRLMQGIEFKMGDYTASFSGNARDLADGTLLPVNSEMGFTTSVSLKDTVRLDYYHATDKSDNSMFYGSEGRLFQGLKATVQHNNLMGGVEYSNEKYEGSNGVFNSMNINSQAMFVGASAMLGEFEVGAMTRVENKDLSLTANLTRGDGQGNTSHYTSTLSSQQVLNTSGVYLKGNNFNATAFNNNFDKGLALNYKSEF